MCSAILYFILTLTGVFFTFNTVNLLYTRSELAAIVSFSLRHTVLPAVLLLALANLHNMFPLMGASKICLVKLPSLSAKKPLQGLKNLTYV